MRNSLFHWLIVMAVVGIVGSVNADPGYLKVENNLNSHTRHVYLGRDDINFSGALDGYDTHDISGPSQPSGYPNCYSDITTHKLWDDWRPEDSNSIYDLKLSFNGSLGGNTVNWLVFDFPYEINPFTGTGDYTFGSKQIIFESDRLPYGQVVDVRKAIQQNGGIVPLIDVPAGTYNQYVPYGTLTLTIGTRLLADLSDNGDINLEDFALLSLDWQNPIQGQYIGDITGASGIPDGFVDIWDLLELVNSWMDSVP